MLAELEADATVPKDIFEDPAPPPEPEPAAEGEAAAPEEGEEEEAPPEEFVGEFVELDDFELGMLDDDARAAYDERRKTLRAKVVDAQAIMSASRPSGSPRGLLPRSGVAGGGGGDEGAEAAAEPPAELAEGEEPPPPEAKTPYWKFVDAIGAVKAAFKSGAAAAAGPSGGGGGSRRRRRGRGRGPC